VGGRTHWKSGDVASPHNSDVVVHTLYDGATGTRGDLTETLQILNGNEIINATTIFQIADNSKGLHGHHFKVFKPRCKTGQKFFHVRVVNEWNSLRLVWIRFITVNTSKNRLDKHWTYMDIHIKPIGYPLINHNYK